MSGWRLGRRCSSSNNNSSGGGGGGDGGSKLAPGNGEERMQK